MKRLSYFWYNIHLSFLLIAIISMSITIVAFAFYNIITALIPSIAILITLLYIKR